MKKVIVVLGTDGSGKSTIIKAITCKLNQRGYNVHYEHLRPNLIPELGVLLGKREKHKSYLVNSDPHGKKTSGLLLSVIRWGYYMFDYTVGFLMKISFVKNDSHTVYIFDRFYQDYYIDPIRVRINMPRWILRLGEYFIPSPNFFLCLGGNPQKIYNRKPETSLEEVSRQVDELHRFCKRKNNAVWIDTTLTFNESVRDTMKIVSKLFNNLENEDSN